MIKTLIELSSNIIAVLAGLLALKKMPIAFRIILLTISLALLNELGTGYLKSKGLNDTWPNNIYLLLDCALFLLTGYLLFHKKNLWVVFIAAFGVFATVWVYNILKTGIFQFAIQAYIIDSLLLLILYGILLYQDALYRKGRFWRSAQLWTCFALISFYGCNIPYFSMLRTVGKLSYQQKEFLHQFLVAINNFHYLLIALAFLIIYLDKSKLINEINRR
jgi:hypothetical protein